MDSSSPWAHSGWVNVLAVYVGVPRKRLAVGPVAMARMALGRRRLQQCGRGSREEWQAPYGAVEARSVSRTQSFVDAGYFEDRSHDRGGALYPHHAVALLHTPLE